MRTLAIIVLLFITGSFTTINQDESIAIPSKDIWIKIGEKVINFELERDEIASKSKEKFSALKFVIKDSPVEMKKMEIYFDNGDKQEVTIIEELKSEGESQAIEFNGGERAISKVVFEYKTFPADKTKLKRAHLELWAKKSFLPND